jgi:uncharacterized membrane protein YphA (DoxX/SURF4 family)
VGLLFLRAAFGLRLMIQSSVLVLNSHGGSLEGWLLASFALAVGASLLLGFLTPLAAGILALVETAVYLLHPASASFFLDLPGFETIIVAIAIALLGPGAISLDAYLFGRRKIVIPRVARS